MQRITQSNTRKLMKNFTDMGTWNLYLFHINLILCGDCDGFLFDFQRNPKSLCKIDISNTLSNI